MSVDCSMVDYGVHINYLTWRWKYSWKRNCFFSYYDQLCLDCKQSLFYLQKSCKPQVAQASEDKWKERLQWFHTAFLILLWQVVSITPLPFTHFQIQHSSVKVFPRINCSYIWWTKVNMVFEIRSNIACNSFHRSWHHSNASNQLVHKIYPYRANGELKTYVVIVELWGLRGPHTHIGKKKKPMNWFSPGYGQCTKRPNNVQ